MIFRNKRLQHIHFTGVGGISMSGLASILLYYGFIVSGSDINPSSLTKDLQKRGLLFFPNHKEENIGNCDLVVHTAAVLRDNPEIKEAHKKGIKVMERSSFLGKLMDEYQQGIGVAGTHGKTTTTGMLATILILNQKDPTILLGGKMDLMNGNYRLGGDTYFLTEACEYNDSFLELRPHLALVLNMDNDHLDYFKDMKGIKRSFRRFMEQVPPQGYLIINGDDRDLVKLTLGLQREVITYGLGAGVMYQAREIEKNQNGVSSYILYEKGKPKGPVTLRVPGEHNIKNSLAAIVSALILGMDMNGIERSLKEFSGTHRRFQLKGDYHGIPVIDDYAHHPREVTATLEAARTIRPKRLLVVFQPHLYSRTRLLLDEFSRSLILADKVIVAEIYGSREKDTNEISSRDLVERIRKLGGDVIYAPTFEEILLYLKKEMKEGDMVLTMGAGDIYQVGDLLLS